MPAPQRYPTPSEQLLGLAKRAKAEGKTFDEFWDRAMPPLQKVPKKLNGKVIGFKTEDDGSPMERPARRLPRVDDPDPPEGAVLWPGDTFERNASFRAAIGAKEGWRRAYEGLPNPGEAALGVLARR